ncbi:MAG: S8 family serine peptidase [Bacteroidetes bacterium]|nr:S8 family serine peptidase [Bacteroidota bacterium]MDA1335402.1 S8 family serine peptidase [Bacteroidota bacterium]
MTVRFRHLSLFCLASCILFTSFSFAQSLVDRSNPLPWHYEAVENDGIPGIALPQALALLDSDQPVQKVKVAVLDTGVNFGHAALQSSVYTNEGEIQGNGIDDDGNGYIDDRHGWNFLVDSLGNNIHYAQYESNYALHLYDSLTSNNLPLPEWLEEIDIETIRTMSEDTYEWVDECWFWTDIYIEFNFPYTELFDAEPIALEQIWYHRKALGIKGKQKKLLEALIEEQVTFEDLEYYVGEVQKSYRFWLNPNYNPRATDEDDRFYGNPRSADDSGEHGTHVAGIIGAGSIWTETNIEAPGIADGFAEIIPVRVVPDGDETDKDVANGIRYAVDAGAKIINMSFGKYVSMDPDRVAAALQYAAENDVLVVHAAGNEANNIDHYAFYPNAGGSDEIEASFINVGATGWQYDEYLIASFSNYGEREVDLFAPGVSIHSTSSDGLYIDLDGTSMAAPVVAGVAAILRANFPELTAPEIKEVLMQSVHKPDFNVVVPGEQSFGPGSPMSKLCKSGGIVNARQAVLRAQALVAKKSQP